MTAAVAKSLRAADAGGTRRAQRRPRAAAVGSAAIWLGRVD
ncbi:MAG: hypothetical protein ACRDOI_33030 [Trebonia sp.]